MLSRQLLAVVNKQCRSFDGSQKRCLMTWHTRHTHTHTRIQFKSFAVESIAQLHKLYVLYFESNRIAFGTVAIGKPENILSFSRRDEWQHNTEAVATRETNENIYEAQYHNQIKIIAFFSDAMETGHCAILRLSFAVSFAQCKWIPWTIMVHTT